MNLDLFSTLIAVEGTKKGIKSVIDKLKKKEEPEQLITKKDIINALDTVCFILCITSLSYASYTLLVGKQDNRLVHSGTSWTFSMAVLTTSPSKGNKSQQKID